MITEQQLTEHTKNYPFISSDAFLEGLRQVSPDSKQKRAIRFLIEELEYMRDNEVQHE